jgi:hypothetical protein
MDKMAFSKSIMNMLALSNNFHDAGEIGQLVVYVQRLFFLAKHKNKCVCVFEMSLLLEDCFCFQDD